MRRAVAALLLFVAVGAFPKAIAHELRPAFLELREKESEVFDVSWKVPVKAGARLALFVRFPDSFDEGKDRTSYKAGESHVERYEVRCPGGLIDQEVGIDGLTETFTDALVRIEWTDGRTQTVRLDSLTTSFVVEDAPAWHERAATYTFLGIEHILLGIDHLLFVLGLLLVVQGASMLVKTITAFTVAHSISLALAVCGVVNVPGRPVDAIIALSIVFLGVEIIKVRRGQAGLTFTRPWIVAFAFGLLHGLGFSGALTSLGLPAGDIPIALLFFNVGVEIGQLLFVFFFLVLAWSFRTLEVSWPRWSRALPAYSIGTIATYWFIDRLLVILAV